MTSSERTDRDESSAPDSAEGSTVLNRLLEWVLLKADRLVLAALVSIGIFVLFVSADAVGVISFVNDDSITRLAGGMIAGTLSLVTLVVSINQLILSREFTAADEARSRLDGVIDFRRDVAAVTDVHPTPASPVGVIDLLAETVADRIDALEAADADRGDQAGRVVGQFVSDARENTAQIRGRLAGASTDTFDAIGASIAYDDARLRYAAGRIQASHAEELSAETHEALEEVIEALSLLAVAREQFKTTYLQRELTRFSQLTIVFGVPSVLSAIGIGLLYADRTGPVIAVSALPVVVSALIAIVLFPLALLVSYIIRTATVTRRTASIGPMLPQKDPDEPVLEALSER